MNIHRDSGNYLKPRVVLIALLASSALVLACGGSEDEPDVPTGAVAQVGDAPILERRLPFLMPANSNREDLRQEGAARLILLEWLKRDASREGLADFASQVPRSMNRPADRTTAKAVSRAEFFWLLQNLLERAAGPPPVAADVSRYYRQHLNEFKHPEVRFMRLVATDTRAQAVAAKRALEEGQAWKSIIGHYSTRDESVAPASGDMGAGPGEMPPGLDEAVYAARTGTFNGPVRVENAWYVFQLTSIDPLPSQSFAQARDQVRIRLQTRRDERGRRLLGDRLRVRYRPITVCAEGIRLPLCRNSPGARTVAASLLEL